jgi:peptide/nickel transport system permease protein
MRRVLLTRLAHAVLVVTLVVTTSFALIRLAPGDPFLAILSDETIPLDVRDQVIASYGFDGPILEQLGRFFANAARGELGWSVSRSTWVGELLGRALPNTLLLMGTAFLLGLAFGVGAGAWQGWRPDSWTARVTDRLGLLVLSIPEFVLALFLLLGPALALRWFPIGGMRQEFGPQGLAGVIDVLHHLALPAFTLAIILAAVVARHQRAATLAVSGAEFVRAARAKGVPEGRIFIRHALRNSLVPVLAFTGVALPSVAGGAVIVEKIFAWPGMGTLTVDAVLSRDYHLVVGSVLVTSVCVVVGTLLADLALLWADPRLRRPS